MNTEQHNQNQQDLELKKELKAYFEKITVPIDYGTIKVQIRDSKPTLITIEKTYKLD